MSQPISPVELGQLFDRHATALELYASQWTNSPEDCVQESLIKLAGQVPCPDSPVAWLYRAVRNAALNASRSARRRNNHEQLASVLSSAFRQSRFDQDYIEELQCRLEQLKLSERELIVLRIWSGLGWEEIAKLLGTSSSTAHRRYVSALEKLKKLLEPSCQKNMNYHEE